MEEQFFPPSLTQNALTRRQEDSGGAGESGLNTIVGRQDPVKKALTLNKRYSENMRLENKRKQ